jgi:dTDP-4-dehydrorhamnose 3,5-epimerase
VYIPKGFAHGFCTLDSAATVDYKMDAPYVPEAAAGLLWSDPYLAIEWPVKDPVISAKDQSWPRFSDFRSPFD